MQVFKEHSFSRKETWHGPIQNLPACVLLINEHHWENTLRRVSLDSSPNGMT